MAGHCRNVGPRSTNLLFTNISTIHNKRRQPSFGCSGAFFLRVAKIASTLSFQKNCCTANSKINIPWRKHALRYLKVTVPLGAALGVYIPWQLSEDPPNQSIKEKIDLCVTMGAYGAVTGPLLVPGVLLLMAASAADHYFGTHLTGS